MHHSYGKDGDIFNNKNEIMIDHYYFKASPRTSAQSGESGDHLLLI